MTSALRCAWLFLVLALLASASPPRASAQPADPHRLRFSLALTLAIDVPAVAALVLLELYASPRVDDRPPAPPSIDVALSEALGSPSHRQAADTLSDIALWGSWIGGAVLSLYGGAAEHGFGGRGLTAGAQDVTFVAEAALATAVIVDVTKLLTARARPEAHFGLPEGRGHNESFFSGHAAQATTLAAASSTVAYLRGYRFAPFVVVGGSAIALACGALRIVALRHWATDVLVGTLVGAAVGIGLPLLLHPRIDESASDDPSGSGFAVSVPLWSGRL